MKIIERVVKSEGAPGENDLWLRTKDDGNELLVFRNGEWQLVCGGGSDGGSDDGGGSSDDGGNCPCVTYPKVNLDAVGGVPDVLGYQTLMEAAEAGDWDKIIFSQPVSSGSGATVTNEFKATNFIRQEMGGLTGYIFVGSDNNIVISPFMSSDALDVVAAIQQRLIDEADGGDYIKLIPDDTGSYFTLADFNNENNTCKISINYLDRNGNATNDCVGDADLNTYFFTATPASETLPIATVSSIIGASMILDYEPFELTEEEVNSLVGLTLMIEIEG